MIFRITPRHKACAEAVPRVSLARSFLRAGGPVGHAVSAEGISTDPAPTSFNPPQETLSQ